MDDLAESVTAFRTAYGLDTSEPVWFVEGGWDAMEGIDPGGGGSQPVTARFGNGPAALPRARGFSANGGGGGGGIREPLSRRYS